MLRCSSGRPHPTGTAWKTGGWTAFCSPPAGKRLERLQPAGLPAKLAVFRVDEHAVNKFRIVFGSSRRQTIVPAAKFPVPPARLPKIYSRMPLALQNALGSPGAQCVVPAGH
jgi:hypothetical protein